MHFTNNALVERHEINTDAGLSIFLWDNHHARAPWGRLIDFRYYSYGLHSFQVFFHLWSERHCNVTRSVECIGGCVGLPFSTREYKLSNPCMSLLGLPAITTLMRGHGGCPKEKWIRVPLNFPNTCRGCLEGPYKSLSVGSRVGFPRR